MADILKIQFVDIKDRNDTAVQTIKSEIARLGSLKNPSQWELEELNRLKRVDAGVAGMRDTLFVTTRYALGLRGSGLVPITLDMDDATGVLDVHAGGARREKADLARVSLILGLLDLWHTPLPRLDVDGRTNVVEPITTDNNYSLFGENLFKAVGKVNARTPLALKIVTLIADAVEIDGTKAAPMVAALDYARVFENMVEQGVSADDRNLKPKVEDSLGQVQETGEERPIHETEISLPDLEATADVQVIKDNVSLFGAMVFASMLDELRAFQVVDQLVESARRGELSLIRGDAGTQLYQYWRQAPNRMSDIERQTFYAMTLGIPTGQPGISVNTEFQDLWLRFVSSVSSLVRESRVDQLLRSALPFAINQQRVKKSARDLVSNMSLFGYGMAYYAAVDLQKQINEMIRLLDDKELRSAFGARDMWGVIDQVAQTELGGARNSSKYRTLATCGAIITKWLAENLSRLRDPTLPIVDLNIVNNPPGRPSGQTATSNPTDYDLVNACELWLADSAVDEDRIEQFAQPRESPQQPSRPIAIPSVARDLLEGAGLGLEMGFGNGTGRARNGRAAAGYRGY
ncbi:MAG: hypothetical protein KDK75_12440 [Alphaproteobacteria bacterium]|nr:hypothetical protein [Alphaproteobacteria bacterium]